MVRNNSLPTGSSSPSNNTMSTAAAAAAAINHDATAASQHPNLDSSTTSSTTDSTTAPQPRCFAPEQATTSAELCDQYQQILQEHIRLSHKYLGQHHDPSSSPLEPTTLSSAMMMMMRHQRQRQDEDYDEDGMSFVSNDIDLDDDDEVDFDYDDDDCSDVASLVDSYFDSADVDSVVMLRRRQIHPPSPPVVARAARVAPNNKASQQQEDNDSSGGGDIQFDFEWKDDATMDEDNDENANAFLDSVNTAFSFDLAVVLQEERER